MDEKYTHRYLSNRMYILKISRLIRKWFSLVQLPPSFSVDINNKHKIHQVGNSPTNAACHYCRNINFLSTSTHQSHRYLSNRMYTSPTRINNKHVHGGPGLFSVLFGPLQMSQFIGSLDVVQLLPSFSVEINKQKFIKWKTQRQMPDVIIVEISIYNKIGFVHIWHNVTLSINSPISQASPRQPESHVHGGPGLLSVLFGPLQMSQFVGSLDVVQLLPSFSVDINKQKFNNNNSKNYTSQLFKIVINLIL